MAKKTSKKQYEFRPGSRVGGKLSPQDVGEELERIRLKTDRLEPKVVVDAARPARAKLHPAFEWEDPKAAELYREFQARQVIRSVVVVQGDKRDPAFVSVTIKSADEPTERFYQSGEVLIQQEDQFASALAIYQEKMMAAARAFEQIKALGKDRGPNSVEILAAIAEALRTARELSSRLTVQ